MSFLDEVDTLRKKSGLARVRVVPLVGLIVLFLLVVVLIAQLIWGIFAVPGIEGNESSLVVEHSTEESDSQVGSGNDDESDSDQDVTSGKSNTVIYVHVAGAVKNPGLYELTQGARVQDAIESAGGMADDALEESINLARVVSDGEQIVVMSKSEESSSSGGEAGISSNASSSSSGGIVAGKVNINRATADEFTTLQGIGEATAAKIIAYRESNGSFKSIEDIKNVSGIGDKKFEAIKDAITV